MKIIEVKNLTYNYPQEKESVLKNVSFDVYENEVLGIIGPSGCGKSTLMLALSGLIPHSIKGNVKGKVILDGKETTEYKMPEISQISQILFQSPDSQLFALNVEDEITFGLENLNLPWNEIEKRLDDAVNMLDMKKIRHNSIEELSSGQKQRVALASILTMRPKILLFDEPTANLDLPSIKNLVNLIKKLKKDHTIIIIEHNTELLENLCDRLILIDNGRLVKQGKPKGVFQSKEYNKIMLPPFNMKEIEDKIKSKQNKQTPNKILQIKNLNFSYSKNSKTLQNINLDIGEGEFLGVLGLNGSGKSTMALNIIGLLKGKGQIIFKEEDISKKDVYERAKRIGYVFQDPNYQLFEETIEREIAFGPKNLGLKKKEINIRIDGILKTINLNKFKESDPHSLSVGQKRRVSIASVLSMNPEIIILDEPDTGLDSKTARSMMDYIKKLNKDGKTIIMISHSLELIAKYCSRIVGMKDGRIVDPKEVYKDYLISL